MRGVHVHAPPPNNVRLTRSHCQTCARQRFFVVDAMRSTCLRCGEMWQDGERAMRPFERGWRQRRIDDAKQLFRRMHGSKKAAPEHAPAARFEALQKEAAERAAQPLPPAPLEYVIFASGGNDSVALVQFAHARGLQNVAVAYSRTGWEAPTWPARMQRFREYVAACGFLFYEIPSEGFEGLVKRKQGFPGNMAQFCSHELKILPARYWLNVIDPQGLATCMVGIRREESAARRSWPEYVEQSENHGGRPLWAPLVNMTQAERDALLASIGWPALPHRSKECSPCVNSNRADFRALDEADVAKVERLEASVQRTMFRPSRVRGAAGIREVMRWAWSERGEYDARSGGCDSGMCGD